MVELAQARAIRAAAASIADVGRHVGMGVANLCNLLNPSRVVLGGDLAESGELAAAGADQGVGRALRDPQRGRQLLSIVPGALGDRAEVLGALALVLSEMGDSSLLVDSAPATLAFR